MFLEPFSNVRVAVADVVGDEGLELVRSVGVTNFQKVFNELAGWVRSESLDKRGLVLEVVEGSGVASESQLGGVAGSDAGHGELGFLLSSGTGCSDCSGFPVLFIGLKKLANECRQLRNLMIV